MLIKIFTGIFFLLGVDQNIGSVTSFGEENTIIKAHNRGVSWLYVIDDGVSVSMTSCQAHKKRRNKKGKSLGLFLEIKLMGVSQQRTPCRPQQPAKNFFPELPAHSAGKW